MPSTDPAARPAGSCRRVGGAERGRDRHRLFSGQDAGLSCRRGRGVPTGRRLAGRLPCPADGARPCRRTAAGKHPAAVEYRRTIKEAQEHLSALLSLLIYNDWITSGRSVLPPRPCGWPSWWRCAPRCGCRRTFPRSRTLPCLPAQPAGCFPAQGRSGWWGSP